ncbi:MAG: hypothetical protein HQK49_17795 [Oligoflexia bacterium]|nr:hypothetical protein [Oligoflexia bacterium]
MSEKEIVIIISKFLGKYKSKQIRNQKNEKNYLRFHYKGYYKGIKVNEILLSHSDLELDFDVDFNFELSKDYLMEILVTGFDNDSKGFLLGTILKYQNIESISLF